MYYLGDVHTHTYLHCHSIVRELQFTENQAMLCNLFALTPPSGSAWRLNAHVSIMCLDTTRAGSRRSSVSQAPLKNHFSPWLINPTGFGDTLGGDKPAEMKGLLPKIDLCRWPGKLLLLLLPMSLTLTVLKAEIVCACHCIPHP